MGEEVKQEASSAPTSQTQSQPATPVSQSAPMVRKNGGAATVIIIVLVVLLALGVGGYFVSRYVAQKAGERLTEGFLGAATGGNVDINSGGEGVSIENDKGSLSLGQSAQWPSDMPSNVPEFSYGKPIMSTKVADGGWSVLYENVSEDAKDKYVSDLSSKGWIDDSGAIDAGSSQIIQMTDGTYNLIIVFDETSKGATLTVSPKVQ